MATILIIMVMTILVIRVVKRLARWVSRNQLRLKYAPRAFFCHLADMGSKRELLERYGWYRNIHGGWTEGHLMDFMDPLEIARLNPAQLEYKLKHGSRAELPPELKGARV